MEGAAGERLLPEIHEPPDIDFKPGREWRSPRTGTVYPVSWTIRAGTLEIITSPKAREAFDMKQETDQTRARYGKFCENFLVARRLVPGDVATGAAYGSSRIDAVGDVSPFISLRQLRRTQCTESVIADRDRWSCVELNHASMVAWRRRRRLSQNK